MEIQRCYIARFVIKPGSGIHIVSLSYLSCAYEITKKQEIKFAAYSINSA